MQKIIFFHHTNYGLTEKIDGVESLAALEHISSFNSEIKNIEFMSFMNLKDNKILFQNNYAPWVINKYISFLLRFFYIIRLCLKYDKIIIYHSLGFIYFFPVFIFFRRKITIQINELYSEISSSKLFKVFEREYLKSFKKHILSNINLKNYLNDNSKVFVRGGYFKSNPIIDKKNGLYFIYAGLVDELKMGNFSIIKSLIKTIPKENKFHLCAITTDKYFNELEKISKDKSNIFLYRSLPKEKLVDIYNLCNYGLVIQDSTKPLNKTSFPSKIYSYLNNNIKPIAISNGILDRSEIRDQIYFIKKYDWQEISSVGKENDNLNFHSKKIIADFRKFIYG